MHFPTVSGRRDISAHLYFLSQESFLALICKFLLLFRKSETREMASAFKINPSRCHSDSCSSLCRGGHLSRGETGAQQPLTPHCSASTHSLAFRAHQGTHILFKVLPPLLLSHPKVITAIKRSLPCPAAGAYSLLSLKAMLSFSLPPTGSPLCLTLQALLFG